MIISLTPTLPEPSRDIAAQFAALADPGHPKRAVWVSRGTLFDPPPLACLELPAGWLYGEAELRDALAADPTIETLAQILGYIEPKSAMRGPLVPVVQALDEDGCVVHEMAVNFERVGEAWAAASSYGRPRIVSLEGMHERRQRLIGEEVKCQKAARSPRSRAS